MRKFFAVAAIIISSQLFAQQKDSIPLQLNHLDNVIITANKFLQKETETGKVITIIDRDMLNKMGGRTVSEILSTASGTYIIGANENLGSNQRVSIRGSSDGNVLILIDGIPVNDPSLISNYFDLNFINTTQIERIEILKGAQSTIYGSDAVSGVINIITKKSASNILTPYGTINYGSYKTFNASAGLKGRTGIVSYNIFGSAISSRGFSSAYDSTNKSNYDRDGFHQYEAHSDLAINLSSYVNISVFENYSYYKADIDQGAFTDDKDFYTKNKNEQSGIKFLWNQKKGSFHLNYEFNYCNRFYLDDSADRSSFSYFSKSNYEGRTHYAEVYENYKLNHINLLAGSDYHFINSDQFYNSVSSFGAYNSNLNSKLAKISLFSVYASIIYHTGRFNGEVGARLNHQNLYGNNSTYSINPSYLITKKIKIFANLSSGFKAPTVFQLFDVYTGNTNLKAEYTKAFEGGIELYIGAQCKLRVNYFNENTDNAIQYIYTDPSNFIGHYQNISNQKRYGIESELTYRSIHWDITANYTYTKGKLISAYGEDGTPLTKDTTYNNLYRVPNNALNAFISYKFKIPISISTLLRYTGIREEPIYQSVPIALDPYFTIDLSGQYSLNKKIRAFIDLKNLTNVKYFDVLGYNSRRFNFSTGFQVGL